MDVNPKTKKYEHVYSKTKKFGEDENVELHVNPKTKKYKFMCLIRHIFTKKRLRTIKRI